MDILRNLLSDIATILKRKNGIEESLSPQEFGSEVLNISSNTISETILSDGGGKSSVSQIKIEEGVQNIGEGAYSRFSFTNVILPSTIESIGESSFYNTAFSEIIIPDSVTTIKDSAFNYCSKLSKIQISSSSNLEALYPNAFANCTKLENIYIPPKVNQLSGLTFNACSKLSRIVVDSLNNTYDSREDCNAIIEKTSNSLVLGCKNTTIPEDVTNIGSFAFGGQSELQYLDLKNITSLGNGAFNGCSSLDGITLNNEITQIYPSVFKGCSSLTEINIPNSCTKIYSAAFSGCKKLTHLTLPSNLNYIDSYTFFNCSSLEKLDFSALTAVPTLANANAFDGTPSSMKIVVPDNLYDVWVSETSTNWVEYGPYGENGSRKNKVIKASEYYQQNS